MNPVFVSALAEAGLTTENLAARVGVDPKTAGRWANPGRIPQTRHRAEVAAALGRTVAELWPEVLERRGPVWFHQWADLEREAVALRWYELAWVPGLLQTEAYARATLAGENLTPTEVDDLVAARIARQSILHRDRPPLLVVVVDELVLRRTAGGDRGMMREQCEHLARCAALPSVQVHVVPDGTGLYAGHGGPFILADMPDGKRVAHVDGQAKAQIIEQRAEMATLDRRWARITGLALPIAQSLALITEAADSWR
ncbi:Scr1 family TA system antitoxin-like transcriptional regulator [Micromonospora sp. WMMD882]|uniref:Scr1 family TA system antitoxin-like transcriptional regulator n=1 Tax=Micromonospora sp. WMMD882 TaxID=3015151 RepID=UPI00248C1C0D|nr:Scr1 family TA system antitoxin-like transcriptional regulator [Micromonospora sp. WMMD882]WBB81549.1 Scr1 family TA system antitoxin-like transcriptional regulator [Micromonospora sp. WMMD882]